MSSRSKLPTCDTCRKRKTRCIELSPPSSDSNNTRCTTCSRLKIPCTYDLGYKKSGRPRSDASTTVRAPRGSTASRSTVERGFRADSPPESIKPRQSVSLTSIYPDIQSLPTPPNPHPHPPHLTDHANPGDNFSLEDLLDWPTAEPVVQPMADITPSSDQVTPDTFLNATYEHHGNGKEGGVVPGSVSSGSSARLDLRTLAALGNNAIENVAPWSTILEFLNIYLKYSQTLFPLVHIPSFCQSLATRMDRTDKDLAALILGVVAYTIGQCPLSRFTHRYTRDQLLSLQRRCHSASMALVDKHHKTISTNKIATLMTAYFYCQSIGKTNQAVVLLAEACQLTHLLFMEDQSNIDCIARELRRRLFWHVYAVDITEACSGHMIHLNSYEGFPPLPLDVDDEYITSQGNFSQPPGTVSSLSGFIGVIQFFPHIAECIIRQRRLQQRVRQNRPLSTEEIVVERAWIAATRLVVDDLIGQLSEPSKVLGTPQPADDIRRAVVGMQRANILVTEASLRLTLLDYALEVEPASQALANEKALVAHTALEVLSAVPLDDLASNGESMRGKICRILYHLLRNGDMFDNSIINSLNSWCNLYSAVHFVQLSRNDFDSCFPSRQGSPALA